MSDPHDLGPFGPQDPNRPNPSGQPSANPHHPPSANPSHPASATPYNQPSANQYGQPSVPQYGAQPPPNANYGVAAAGGPAVVTKKKSKVPLIVGLGCGIPTAIVIIIIIAVAVGTANSTPTTGAPASQAASQPAASKPAAPQSAPSEPASSQATEPEEQTIPVTIEFEGQDGKGKVTINDYAWSKKGFTAPENTYLAIDVTVEGVEGKVSYNPLYFTVQDADAREYNITIGGSKEPSLQSGDLAPGKKARGWVEFDLPQGAVTLKMTDEFLQDVLEVSVPAK